MKEEEVEEVIKGIVELLEVMSKNIDNNIISQERIVTTLENVLRVLTIHEERITELSRGSGHTHWWQF